MIDPIFIFSAKKAILNITQSISVKNFFVANQLESLKKYDRAVIASFTGRCTVRSW